MHQPRAELRKDGEGLEEKQWHNRMANGLPGGDESPGVELAPKQPLSCKELSPPLLLVTVLTLNKCHLKKLIL